MSYLFIRMFIQMLSSFVGCIVLLLLLLLRRRRRCCSSAHSIRVVVARETWLRASLLLSSERRVIYGRAPLGPCGGCGGGSCARVAAAAAAAAPERRAPLASGYATRNAQCTTSATSRATPKSIREREKRTTDESAALLRVKLPLLLLRRRRKRRATLA